VESFGSRVHDEVLSVEALDTVLEVQARGLNEHGPRFCLAARYGLGTVAVALSASGFIMVLDGETLWPHEVVDVGTRERVCRGDSVLLWHTITALRSGLVGRRWDAGAAERSWKSPRFRTCFDPPSP
jgi:hypothetical protein